MSFGTLAVGGTSTATLTITNSSASGISVNSITATGDFSATHECGTSIAANGSCTVSVTFSPKAVGTRAGGLTIDDTSSTGPHIVPLDGAGGIAQSLVVTPSYLTFARSVVGSGSSQTITVTNSGANAINVSTITIAPTGDFAQSNTCGSTLAGSGNCTISVSFSATSRGTHSATLSIGSDAPGSPLVVPLSAEAYDNVPTISLVQPSLVFTSTAVGTTSSSLTAQFMSLGSASLDVYSIVASGDFAQTNSCTSPMAKGTICTMSVTFKPTAAGTRTGAITIADNAPGSPHTIGLNGTGTGGAAGPLVSLSTTGIAFPGTGLGSKSDPATVTLRNVGTDVLALTGISASGDFAQTNACGNALAAGASCVVSVTFAPTDTGIRSGAVTFVDSAPGSPHAVLLSGTGTGLVGPRLSASPAAVVFGARTVGVPGGSIDVSISNPGSERVTLSSISVSGDFTATGCRDMVLAPHASCTVSVAFTPTTTGTRTGGLTIVDDAPGSPHVVPLSGEGTYGRLLFSPTSLSFSSLAVGSTSAAISITLTNPASIAIAITSVTATGDFAATNDCGSAIGANGTCTVSVTFTPSASGVRTGTLTIVDDAPGSPHEIPLKGTGTSS